jgi:tetratricopeptide (TPR) repeat protein
MRAAGTVLLLLLAGLAASTAPTNPADPAAPADTALAQGNLLFEKDEIEAALEAYARGWTGDGARTDGVLAGVLAYNAGTCALRLGRLPEALLWYRRAESAIPGDPWLRDNLSHTRRALGGDPEEEEEDPAVWRSSLAFVGVALAWAALLLVVLARHPSRGLLALLALLACISFAAGMLPNRFGPRAAVLLLPCGGLPAGSEVRVHPLDGGGWRIVGQGDRLRCPAEGVGLVGPRP